MRLPRVEAFVCFLLAALLSAPAWGDTTSAHSALPGTLNYVEGQAEIGDTALNSKSIGSAELQPGESLKTTTGKAEVLLTPGVFLRVGNNSSVRMVSPSITDTVVALKKGHAMIEVDEIHPENNIRVNEDGADIRLLKTGLYDFNANRADMRVFDGKAAVVGYGRHFIVKGGHYTSFADHSLRKPKKFTKKEYEEGDLYRWSSLRSAYVAEANVNAAGYYSEYGYGPWGPGWWGADWYWDPWFDSFTFIPGDGIFYSPFGWGFYSPWWVYDAPLWGYGGFGFGAPLRHPYYHHFSTDVRTWGKGPHYPEGRTYARGIYRGPGSIGSGFHSGPRMTSRGFSGFHEGAFHGGGLHGAAGGFHGGGLHGGGFGGGGGFHGGGFSTGAMSFPGGRGR